MIACSRSLFRGGYALKFVNFYVESNPVNYFQGYCSCYSLSFNKRMSKAKDRLGAVDMNKKQKTVVCLWRPVSTQASSIEESLINDATVESEVGGQAQEVHGGVSGFISNVQEMIKVAKEVTDSTISSRALKDNVEDGTLEGEPVISAEKHTLSMKVGASLFRFIKGRGGDTQKMIEEDMGVKIVFPSSKEEESILIEGISIDSITRASERIKAVLDEAVKSRNLDYSHFVSLPLAIYPELVDKLVNFQKSVLGNGDASLDENLESDSIEDTSDNEDKDQESNKGQDVVVELKVEDDKHVKVDVASIPRVSYAPKASKPPTVSDLGIDKSIFIKPKLFHLTVLMLKLWNNDRVNAASDVLKSISSKVMDALDNRPVCVRLKGLDRMKGSSWAKARVLYATVEEIGSEDRLLRACHVIIDAFVEAGLVLENDAKKQLKLHATVMNARHRKLRTGQKRRNFDTFDARGIFKQFGSEEWGEYLIREAHLSQRFVYDENGYYHCCASIPFPESMQVD